MIELFRIGFLSVTLFDLLDVGIVTALFYFIYKSLKHTIALQVLFGLMIVMALSFVSEAMRLRSLNWILHIVTDIWLLAFIIIFQQELRKMLMEVTKHPIFRFLSRKQTTYDIDDVVSAVQELSIKNIGALIIFPKAQQVEISLVDAGIPINANISKELILALFNTKAPLHDGAVIIYDNQITAARCILPLSATTRIGTRLLGTRHRAGLGLTEKVDAVVVIVSEETGTISIAQNGQINMGIPHNMLKQVLEYVVNDTETSDNN